ncbi:MAG: hypothetical protein HY908_07370 [Myxococcales bacterium]|nr:hypothetical protein [Myxococcales bacterium]
MHKTAFSHSVRMLLCGRCGAPLDAPPAGGDATCPYCHTRQQLRQRDESRERAAARQVMGEPERFERLRSQDGKPLIPPQSLMPYLAGGALAPAYAPQALAEWQQARLELASGAPYPTEERFYFLTLLVSQHFMEQQDELRQRGMLETALELVTAPRHKQVLRCMLARSAARAGDLEAAEEWLEPCNPWSDDLHMDTAYRFARGYLATVRQDWQGVLQALGSRIGDVPIADSQDHVCALVRANALERMGRGQEAVGQLRQMMTSPDAVAAFDRMRAAHATLDLCPQSYAEARAMLAPALVRRPTPGATGCGVYVFLVLGVVFLVVAGLALAVRQGWLSVSGIPVLGLMPGMALEILAGVLGFNGLIFTTLAVVFMITGARKRRLRETGLPGRAQLLSVEGTGVLVNGQPMLAFELVVTVAGQAPYPIRHREVIPALALSRLAPGSSVAVKVDPKDPSRLMIDWSEP